MQIAERDAVRASALAFIFMVGCTGDITDLKMMPGGGDMTMNGTDDMGGTDDMDNMSGGDMTGMQQAAKFTPDIENDIATLGCVGCHNTGSGRTLIVTGTNIDADYTSFTAQANTGANSPVLTKNLAVAAGGNDAAHPSHPFNDTTNAVYVRWLAWIGAGNVKGP
jgi:hypothetical protein